MKRVKKSVTNPKPAAKRNASVSKVDLTAPAAAKLLTTRGTGQHIINVTITP